MREGKNIKGRLLGVVLGTVGRRVLEKAFVNSVKAIVEHRLQAGAAQPGAAAGGELEPVHVDESMQGLHVAGDPRESPPYMPWLTGAT